MDTVSRCSSLPHSSKFLKQSDLPQVRRNYPLSIKLVLMLRHEVVGGCETIRHLPPVELEARPVHSKHSEGVSSVAASFHSLPWSL